MIGKLHQTLQMCATGHNMPMPQWDTLRHDVSTPYLQLQLEAAQAQNLPAFHQHPCLPQVGGLTEYDAPLKEASKSC